MKKSATKVMASLFCVVLLFSCLTFQVSAQTVRDVEYFDDGSYVVTELLTTHLRAPAKVAQKPVLTMVRTIKLILL